MKKSSFLYLIPVLLMLAVPFQTAADDFVRGDCDQDGVVNISDVTCLIDYLLNNQWPGEGEIETYTVNGVSFKMVKVEGGVFTMGATAEQSNDAWSNEKPAHQVTLSSFSIGNTEVTQELWTAVMGNNPSSCTTNYTEHPLRPVETVSWEDCQEFITRLNEMTGLQFRLPTEAEWEYAARGGKKTNGYKYSGSNNVEEVAWCFDYWNSSINGYGPCSVGCKKANELGLYDMSGNVWEWVNDWFGDYGGAAVNPTGPETGTKRVVRGGDFAGMSTYCRVSFRHSIDPASASVYIGLRLAL